LLPMGLLVALPAPFRCDASEVPAIRIIGVAVLGHRYGTAATRSHARAARHPEGTLFLCFLLALLVLVVVLGAPCQRRALGDAVLLPDEEDM